MSLLGPLGLFLQTQTRARDLPVRAQSSVSRARESGVGAGLRSTDARQRLERGVDGKRQGQSSEKGEVKRA